MISLKIEFEVKAFGKVEVPGTEDAFQSAEIARVIDLPKETTLAELESVLSRLFSEVENGYGDPEQLLGKITIRTKKTDDEIQYLG